MNIDLRQFLKIMSSLITVRHNPKKRARTIPAEEEQEICESASTKSVGDTTAASREHKPAKKKIAKDSVVLEQNKNAPNADAPVAPLAKRRVKSAFADSYEAVPLAENSSVNDDVSSWLTSVGVDDAATLDDAADAQAIDPRDWLSSMGVGEGASDPVDSTAPRRVGGAPSSSKASSSEKSAKKVMLVSNPDCQYCRALQEGKYRHGGGMELGGRVEEEKSSLCCKTCQLLQHLRPAAGNAATATQKTRENLVLQAERRWRRTLRALPRAELTKKQLYAEWESSKSYHNRELNKRARNAKRADRAEEGQKFAQVVKKGSTTQARRLIEKRAFGGGGGAGD